MTQPTSPHDEVMRKTAEFIASFEGNVPQSVDAENQQGSIACSDCFVNEGLRLDAELGDVEDDSPCDRRARCFACAQAKSDCAAGDKNNSTGNQQIIARRMAGAERYPSSAIHPSMGIAKRPTHPTDRATARLRLGPGLHAARFSRSALNVPSQRSIRDLMLLHAARRARSSLCGESATRPSSISRPIGP
jgi:hypothetical protein